MQFYVSFFFYFILTFFTFLEYWRKKKLEKMHFRFRYIFRENEDGLANASFFNAK